MLQWLRCVSRLLDVRWSERSLGSMECFLLAAAQKIVTRGTHHSRSAEKGEREREHSRTEGLSKSSLLSLDLP